MNIPIVFTVHASEAFDAKKTGKRYVKLTGTGLGLGLFQFVVPEERVPDPLEGKTFNARFKLYVGKDLSVRLGFEGIDSYVSEG